MNIEQIRAEVTESFNEWDVLSRRLTFYGFYHNEEWPDFPVIGSYVLSLVNAAYEAGINESGKKLFKKGIEEGKRFNKSKYIKANKKSYRNGFEAGKAIGYQNGWDFGYTEGVEASEDYRRGYEAAAKDPKAWELNDLNIGDIYKRENGRKAMVLGFLSYGDPDDGMLVACGFDNCNVDKIGKCKKVTPDTREKIIEDLATQFSAMSYDGLIDVDDELRDLAEEFVARVEALEK